MGSRGGEATGAQGGLYYYLNAFAECLNALGKPAIETKQGERPWANDLFAALKERQQPDWWEKDPVLVTTYCLNAMNLARPYLNGKN